MTTRFIIEDSTSINRTLSEVDLEFPALVASFIDKKRRKDDRWQYKVVSSQLDADRLDYLLRDAYYCGLKGHGFDLARILDLLQHHNGNEIAVEEGALEALEAYLVALDQSYRAIYYHHAVRSGNRLLTSLLRRAVHLDRNSDKTVLGGKDHPLNLLVKNGQKIDLPIYARLGEYHLWALIESWQFHKDTTLQDLSQRLMRRQLFKTFAPKMDCYDDYKNFSEILQKAKDIAIENVPLIDVSNVDHYVCDDAAERTSYKTYDWKADSANESIWIVGANGKAEPIEDHARSTIIQGLKKTRYFPRIMMPAEVRDALLAVT
jgi:HD superfamily phosphohydrolase